MWQINNDSIQSHVNRNFLRAVKKKMPVVFALLCLFLLAYQKEAMAARSFSISLPSVVVTMGDAAGTNLIYTITNTNTGGDAGKSIRRVTFNLPAGYNFGAGMAAPAGWAILSQTATQIVFDTASGLAPPKIAQGSSQVFTLVLGAIPSGAQDSTDRLASVTGVYDSGQSKNYNNPVSSAWTRRSLSVDSFVASPDGVVPVTGTFTLTLTVTNHSTSNWTIVSNTQPPTAVTAGISVTTASNPSTVINAGAQGTLVWNYTASGGGMKDCANANPSTGTVYFTVTGVRNTTSVATSKTGTYTSNTVNVGCFTGTLSINNTCISSATNVTVTMNLSNKYSNDIKSVAPALTLGGTAPTKTLVSGPSSTGFTMTSGSTATVTWVYTIAGGSGDTYLFSSTTTTGILQSGSKPTITAAINQSSTGNIVSPPTATVISTPTVDRTNMVGITWQVTNPATACYEIKQVDITNQLGWKYLDSSPVNPTDWSNSFTDPTVGFAAGTNISINGNGSFMIFFSSIPATQGNYTFPIMITDTTNAITNINTTVTIGADPGTNSITAPGLWKEDVR